MIDNMNVTLIPFFLAANVVVNNEDSRGVKWTFMHNTTLDIRSSNESRTFNLSATVKCQSRNSTTIGCDWTWNDEEVGQKSTEIFSFEFDERGVKTAIVKNKAYRQHLINIKRLAAVMSVDAPLTGERNFTAGECDTFFDVMLKRTEEAQEKQDAPYKLQLVQFPEWTSGMSVQISRTSKPETCSQLLWNYFNYIIYEHVNVEKYESSMHIQDPTVFESRRYVKGTYMDEKGEIFHVYENQVLQLMSIDEIKDDLPDLPEEEKTTITYRMPGETFLLHEHIFP